jgi:hypothetical protein
MSTNLLANGAAGTLFGAALAVSGVYSPAVIVSQMQLADFHMLKVFLGASVSSAYVSHTLRAAGKYSTADLFS